MSLTKNAADFIFVFRAANQKPNKLTEISLLCETIIKQRRNVKKIKKQSS